MKLLLCLPLRSPPWRLRRVRRAPTPPSTQAPADGQQEPLLVVASIYPMQYFAERVGSDRVEVVALVPPGVEGHTFELTPRDLLTIADADVIAMNGLELEPWLERALESLGDDVSGIVVEAADAEAGLAYEAEEGEDHDEEEGDHEAEGRVTRKRRKRATTRKKATTATANSTLISGWTRSAPSPRRSVSPRR